MAAAATWDHKQYHRVALAECAYYSIDSKSASVSVEEDRAFNRALNHVRWTRYRPPDRPPAQAEGQWERTGSKEGASKEDSDELRANIEGRAMQKQKQDEEKPFDIRRSIWAPREKWCDAKDFIDTDDVIWSRFANDWRQALEMGAVKMIMRYDDNADEDKDGDGVPDEIEEVGAVLFRHNRLWTMLFSFYSEACYSSGDDIDLVLLNGCAARCEQPSRNRL